MCWGSFWICGKGLLWQKKKLLSIFSTHCSVSSDASSLLWNPFISSWAKCRTLNTIWQDCVWHFWDSQAISPRFWVKTATAPFALQKACELYTHSAVMHTDVWAGLVAVTASWQSRTRKRQAVWYGQLALCTATRAPLCGASIDQDILYRGQQVLMLQHQPWAHVISQKPTQSSTGLWNA